MQFCCVRLTFTRTPCQILTRSVARAIDRSIRWSLPVLLLVSLFPLLLVLATPYWRVVQAQAPHLLPVLAVVVVMHVYLWHRLCRDTHLPPKLWWLGTCLIAGAALAFPSTWIVLFSASTRHWWHIPILDTWLGIAVYVSAVLASFDALRLGSAVCRRVHDHKHAVPTRHELKAASPGDSSGLQSQSREALPTTLTSNLETPSALESRRVFLARAAAGAALSAGGVTAAFGMRSALWDITTPEVSIALPRLPRALDGYTIALLTDIHIGQTLRGRFLRHLVEQTNRLRPDAIAIGGDLVDGRVDALGSHVAELRHLQARDGVFYVTGNHEYAWGPGEWMAFISKLGVRVLSNERVALGDADARGAQFDLAGVPDLACRNFGIAPDLDRALVGRAPSRELVVLAHQPRMLPDAVRVGAGLQLSGHTHGGQLNPFGAVVAYPMQRYVAGLYRHEDTATQIYVSRGSGCLGPPMRVFAPAEITCIRLVQA